ncbi:MULTISPECIES: aldehyde dehydrogenase [Cycloclasticus]|jgi:acyl-CoA reductase-like NAD-dependent aldehyde dehydrogenase|uniref:Salicylaldehyde dehydrogenase n=1 Tax=Cycloclasticus pugetii TaxID=34068 RepID=A0AB33Z1X9_9GAMM|nr:MULTISPECIES: aldehyde dehydrogenase [Cycloclasticus]ATI02000.1 aldehyde dehydrogenase [Cycloclasticus sp. PY97N]EPD13258.1 Dehydrogenase PhnF [Cycloclasticus pugetii]SHJ18210.1 Acyl-CoA reductase [Cycloclasticus pugetii]|tara:strand:+ start:3912 stop:5369 length:1458 start_codon:yes stop_codon:yes gene_type:complete
MKTQLIINNEAVDASNGATFERLNSLTGNVVSQGAAATIDDANKAAETAAIAFKTWSETGPTERRALLLKAADILESKTNDIIQAMAAEVGASALWSGFNVMMAAGLFREAAGLTTQVQGETIPTDKPDTLSMTFRQPVGVVLSMAPWNGPVALAARAIAYPIAFGNTVVFRASEVSPKTHLLVCEALFEAGLPAGVLNVITHASEDAPQITEALIAHPAIRRINFTGSTRVGSIIAQQAAKHLKRCLLELGGKSPLVILDDANIDEAVRAAVFGCFLYQGQICMTTGRIIVDEKVADEFIEKFAAATAQLTMGNPAEPGNEMCIVGPLIDSSSGERLNSIVKDATDKGANVVSGGTAEGASMPATILDNVTADMRAYHEESFGPVISIIRVKDDEQALFVANDTEYGLSASVFSRDFPRAMKMAKHIESGICHINSATVNGEAQAPYGGTKATGYGRFDGRAVIDEFTELRWVTVAPNHVHYPF